MLGPLLGVLGPLLTAVEGAAVSLAQVTGDAITGGDFDYSKRHDAFREKSQKDDEKKTKDAAAEQEKTKPKMYMTPRTVNVYTTTEECEPGCFLLASNVISNDDSNLVMWEIIPNFIALAFGAGAGDAYQLVRAAGVRGRTVPLGEREPRGRHHPCAFLDNHEAARDARRHGCPRVRQLLPEGPGAGAGDGFYKT